jgi:3-hydroxy-3-methylglutaryl CoA synthase
MKPLGIEKIRVYPTALQLNLDSLAGVRGYDVAYMHKELMVERRGVNPPWEDPVTMAVNAAKPMLTPEDIDSIGLLIVSSESGLDQEKSLSSWVFHHLGLKSSCRHFEIKIACYAGTAALRMAMAWLGSPLAKKGQKALIINTDESLISLHKPWEYNSGGGAVAMLISDQPDFFAYEDGKFGIYAHDVTDVIRPLPWLEIANNEISLFSYMEALAAAYENYEENVGAIDFTSYFNYNVYHVPFSGISFRAHKQLMSINTDASAAEVREDFNRRVQPSLCYADKIGATYGGSIFIALLGLIDTVDVQPNDRIGIYSYGSGSCAEFYSGLVGEKSKEAARQAGLQALLNNRFELTVAQYELLENERVKIRQSSDCTVNRDLIPGLYETAYQGKELLIYTGATEYCRSYEVS